MKSEFLFNREAQETVPRSQGKIYRMFSLQFNTVTAEFLNFTIITFWARYPLVSFPLHLVLF